MNNTPDPIRDILEKALRENDLMLNGPVPSKFLYISDPYTDPADIIIAEAEQAINAYILGEVMAIIGDDLPTDMFGSWTCREDGTMILLSDEVIITNNLKAELRNKANKKFGGK